jgi:hypothetical protein
MQIHSKESLPLKSPSFSFELDEAKVAKFKSAFKSSSKAVPPTATAMMMKGVFDLIQDFKVDWKHLLHATQSYQYIKPLELPTRLRAESSLMDHRFRAGIHWLNFETPIYQHDEKEPSVVCKTLIMVKEAA